MSVLSSAQTDPRDNFVRLPDKDCYVVPSSAIDFHPRTDLLGPQSNLLETLNTLCFCNQYRTIKKLEELLFARRLSFDMVYHLMLFRMEIQPLAKHTEKLGTPCCSLAMLCRIHSWPLARSIF